VGIHAERHVEGDVGAIVGFGLLNAPLDFAEVVEILGDALPVARAQAALQETLGTLFAGVTLDF